MMGSVRRWLNGVEAVAVAIGRSIAAGSAIPLVIVSAWLCAPMPAGAQFSGLGFGEEEVTDNPGVAVPVEVPSDLIEPTLAGRDGTENHRDARQAAAFHSGIDQAGRVRLS